MQKCMSDYLDTVCAEIRGKALRQSARAELMVHISELCGELISDGMDETAAARTAVARMGDPEMLGRRITAANRPRKKVFLLISGFVLALAGLAFISFYGGGSLSLIYDSPSAIAVITLSSAYALLACGGRVSLRIFAHGVKTGALYSGVLCSVVGAIVMLQNLDDPSALGPGLAVTLLSIVYGILLSAGARAAENWLIPPESAGVASLLDDTSLN